MPRPVVPVINDTYIERLKAECREYPDHGQPPSILSEYYVKPLLEENAEVVDLQFSDGTNQTSLKLLKHSSPHTQGHVLTSIDCLTKDTFYGIGIERVPQILDALAKKLAGQQFVAMQFTIAITVTGQISGATHRAHFNHLLIYKDINGQLNSVIIDSTMNPFGVYNPLPLMGWLFTTSIVSGKPLQSYQINTILNQDKALHALQRLFGSSSMVNEQTPILTGVQPSSGDKRCGLFVVNTMAHLIDYFRFTEQNDLVSVVTAAHHHLDEVRDQASVSPCV